ncbi:hypothetical protein D3C84_271990 [compost metagenome]
MLGGGTQDALAGADRAGEDYLVDLAMPRQIGANFPAATTDQVHGAARQAGTFDGLQQDAQAQR